MSLQRFDVHDNSGSPDSRKASPRSANSRMKNGIRQMSVRSGQINMMDNRFRSHGRNERTGPQHVTPAPMKERHVHDILNSAGRSMMVSKSV